MFCYQCEQTSNATACTRVGVCGKSPEVSLLQDLLLHQLKGIGWLGRGLRQMGAVDDPADRFVIEALFSTVTNVDFDPQRLKAWIDQAYRVKEDLKEKYLGRCEQNDGRPFPGRFPEAVAFIPAGTMEGLQMQGAAAGIMANPGLNPDIRSLRELLAYGLKGMAAYADHAAILGESDKGVNSFFHRALAAMLDDGLAVSDLLELNMELGRVNLRCMEILDQGHTQRFGHPVPTPVSLGARRGPAILVSGHDLLDLFELLRQTEGRGIQVYTHGEMLPAHGYPGLKKFPHLAGNYGGAWQDQQKEFERFPGPILMTTNCIQKPRPSYADRIFTTGLVAWPGVTHIPDRRDFSLLIAKAVESGGFAADEAGRTITVGFGHQAVLGAAEQVVAAVKAGQIRHFFLIGGCDGARSGRNYYSEFAEKVPADCVILTLACGKYRFNKLDFGTVAGLPRLMDVGQCNDAYSAIQIALALAKAFGVGVNELPLSLVLSWYEQKAVIVLLTLLALGVRNIRLGPTLPAFLTPNVLKVLVDKFAIKPIGTADEDIRLCLQGEK
ncbi:MAG: hydroxylamine reductase [Acidobacteria bacterium]|nr:hydroxylamine reductase [Acidobacteriota bacterium]